MQELHKKVTKWFHKFYKHPFRINCKKLCRYRHRYSMRWSLKRQRLTRQTALSIKTIKLPTEEQTVCLCTITPCYLLMPSTNIGPVARIKAISVANVANLMSEATALLMGKLVTNVKVLIISERCVIQRYQTGQHRALTRRSHSNRPGGCLQAAMAKEEASSSSRRRRQRSIHHRSRKHTR